MLGSYSVLTSDLRFRICVVHIWYICTCRYSRCKDYARIIYIYIYMLLITRLGDFSYGKGKSRATYVKNIFHVRRGSTTLCICSGNGLLSPGSKPIVYLESNNLWYQNYNIDTADNPSSIVIERNILWADVSVWSEQNEKGKQYDKHWRELSCSKSKIYTALFVVYYRTERNHCLRN